MNHAYLLKQLSQQFKILDIKYKQDDRDFIFLYMQKYRNNIYIGEIFYEWQFKEIKYLVNVSNIQNINYDFTNTFCILIVSDNFTVPYNHIYVRDMLIYDYNAHGSVRKKIRNKFLSNFSSDIKSLLLF